ncbi:MAG: hypothetical protein WCS13_04735 [Candidatus Cloacimonadaceae bacterium]
MDILKNLFHKEPNTVKSYNSDTNESYELKSNSAAIDNETHSDEVLDGYILTIDTNWSSEDKQRPNGKLDHSKLKGTIITPSCDVYSFTYNQLTFNITKAQVGMHVTFKPVHGKNCNRAENITKDAAWYGFLEDFDGKTGHLSGYYKPVVFSKQKLRKDFEPFFDTIYKYDIALKQEDLPDIYELVEFDQHTLQIDQTGYGIVKKIELEKKYIFSEILPSIWVLSLYPLKLQRNLKLKIGDQVVIRLTDVSFEQGRWMIKGSILKKVNKDNSDELIAVNVLRVDNLNIEGILESIDDISNNSSIDIKSKLYMLKLISSRRDLYKAITTESWNKLVSDCKQKMDELILKRQYSEAYEILTDLAVYDFSVIDNLQEFPQEFINSIKSCKIQFENRDLIDDDQAEFIFARKHGCSINDAKKYLQMTHECIWNDEFEKLHLSLGIKSVITLPQEDK